MFMTVMIPTLFRNAYKQYRKGILYTTMCQAFSRRRNHRPLYNSRIGDPEDSESEVFIKPTEPPTNQLTHSHVEERDKHLGIIPTARLSFAFCLLWFGANYFAMACLQFTSVASTTILTSTSSFWTLLIGAFTGVEKFTWRKLCGVFGSLVGVVLISRVDLSASVSNEPATPRMLQGRLLSSRAIVTFPEKPASEMALGDAMALFSAIIYGVYTITLKRSTIKALPRSLNMPLFFGLVGMFNLLLLFPLFPVLHFTGLERFEPPPSRHIWTILLVNGMSSLLSDICWAYSMVLTSPLVITVGLSLTIPLSLVGEMILQGHYEGWVYWLGASIVVGSFLFVDHEERGEESNRSDATNMNEDGDQERYEDGQEGASSQFDGNVAGDLPTAIVSDERAVRARKALSSPDATSSNQSKDVPGESSKTVSNDHDLLDSDLD